MRQHLPPGELVRSMLRATYSRKSLDMLKAYSDNDPVGSEIRRELSIAMSDPQSQVRARAVRYSRAFPTETESFRSAWLFLLDDPVPWVRKAACAAVSALVDTDFPIHRRLIGVTLTDSNPSVRCAAAKAIGARIDPERDYGEALRHNFERQRERAVVALGYAATNPDSAVRLLLDSIRDSHPRVRAAAILSLGKFPISAEVWVVLQKKCNEKERRVSRAARQVCAGIRDGR